MREKHFSPTHSALRIGRERWEFDLAPARNLAQLKDLGGREESAIERRPKTKFQERQASMAGAECKCVSVGGGDVAGAQHTARGAVRSQNRAAHCWATDTLIRSLYCIREVITQKANLSCLSWFIMQSLLPASNCISQPLCSCSTIRTQPQLTG